MAKHLALDKGTDNASGGSNPSSAVYLEYQDNKMKNYRTSKIWIISKEELEQIVITSDTYSEVVEKLGLSGKSGNNISLLKERIKFDNINHDNLKQKGSDRMIQALKSSTNKKLLSLEIILTENSTYDRGRLKKRLISEGIIVNKCSKCGLENEWQGQPISLQIDHINGIRNDNRLENLRLLCPNCHSQTDTFSGKTRKGTGKKRFCLECGISIYRTSNLCKKCNNKLKTSKRKVVRPLKEELSKLLEEYSYIAVGKMYGVSDNAVRKWIKQYEK